MVYEPVKDIITLESLALGGFAHCNIKLIYKCTVSATSVQILKLLGVYVCLYLYTFNCVYIQNARKYICAFVCVYSDCWERLNAPQTSHAVTEEGQRRSMSTFKLVRKYFRLPLVHDV